MNPLHPLPICFTMLFTGLPEPASANVVWPAACSYSGFSSLLIILLSLGIGYPAVKKITGLSGQKSIVITLVFNLISFLIGLLCFGLTELGLVNGYELIILAQAGWLDIWLSAVAFILASAVNFLSIWITFRHIFRISMGRYGLRVMLLICLATTLLPFIYGRINPMTI